MVTAAGNNATGTSQMHFITASDFAVCGIIFLSVTLHRIRNLKENQNFCLSYIPERNKWLLSLVAIEYMALRLFWKTSVRPRRTVGVC